MLPSLLTYDRFVKFEVRVCVPGDRAAVAHATEQQAQHHPVLAVKSSPGEHVMQVDEAAHGGSV